MTRRPTVKADVWYALRRAPDALPVIFDRYADARDNADPDEAVYRVRVTNLACLRDARDEGER